MICMIGGIFIDQSYILICVFYTRIAVKSISSSTIMICTKKSKFKIQYPHSKPSFSCTYDAYFFILFELSYAFNMYVPSM